MKNLSFDWNDLKFFLAVARHGGLSSAALVLHTSASTVSRHIAALENRLKTTLFVRLQTGYLLTDDGNALLRHVEQVEQAMIATQHSNGDSLHNEIRGQVCLATTEMLATYLIVPQLPLFRARYPNLQVEIKISLSRANLSRREADLALRIAESMIDGASADYIASRIGTMEFSAYCAAGLFPKRAGKAAIAWQEFDYISWDEAWADLPMAKWLRGAFADKPPALICNSLQAHYAAIKAGLGVGMLPRFIGDRDPGLQSLEDKRAAPSRDLWLVYHRDMKASQRVAAMREFIKELLDAGLGK